QHWNVMLDGTGERLQLNLLQPAQLLVHGTELEMRIGYSISMTGKVFADGEHHGSVFCLGHPLKKDSTHPRHQVWIFAISASIDDGVGWIDVNVQDRSGHSIDAAGGCLRCRDCRGRPDQVLVAGSSLSHRRRQKGSIAHYQPQAGFGIDSY